MKVVKSAVIGSGNICDLIVADPWASTMHCMINQWSNGSFTIEDLGSTNGTYIRNVPMRIEPYKLMRPAGLMVGDEIKVGRTWILWKGMA